MTTSIAQGPVGDGCELCNPKFADAEEAEPYCRDCGCERLIFLAEYANGQEYKCRDCGTEFMW